MCNLATADCYFSLPRPRRAYDVSKWCDAGPLSVSKYVCENRDTPPETYCTWAKQKNRIPQAHTTSADIRSAAVDRPQKRILFLSVSGRAAYFPPTRRHTLPSPTLWPCGSPTPIALSWI